MSNILDVSNNKRKCQKFTPEDMVNTMLDLIGYSADLMGKKVLENSFGSGNIITVIVKRYIEDCIRSGIGVDVIAQNLSKDIIGIERDKSLFGKCIRKLNKIIKNYNLPSVKWNLHNADALKWNYKEQYDYIIGNPPYISYKSIDKDNREMIRKKFSTCKKGKFDYCYAFIELGVNHLKQNGKMVQLVPSNIFKNVFAEDLRVLLLPHISVIYEYPSQNLFESALTSTSIFLYDKSCVTQMIKYRNVTNNIENNISRQELDGKWMFSNDIHEEDNEIRFGDLFNASIVIATLYNKAYIVNSEQIEENELEMEIIRHTVSPRSLRYGREEFIIFPYRYVDKMLTRIKPEEFEQSYPSVVKYLHLFDEKLKARNSDENSYWYEYGRSQALAHLNQNKLLMSTIITDSVEVYTLNANIIPYSGIYITQLDENYTLEYAEEILRSQAFMEYVKKVGIAVSGTSIRISCKDINNFRFVRR